MLMASGIVMWFIIRQHEKKKTLESTASMLSGIMRMSKILVILLVWIAAGSIPRMLTFRSFEWTNAANQHNMEGLIARHVATFVIVMSGTYMWIKISRKLKQIKNTL